MNQKDLLESYALSWLGKEYIYGGQGPFFDCSGLVIELLKSVGMQPPHDQTAQQLFEYFMRSSTWGKEEFGALAFYGRSTNSISHVAFLLNDKQIIEAGGGTGLTTTIEKAREMNAFIRVRPLRARGDLVACLGLEYPFPL